MSYFSTVAAKSLSHAALVFGLTACPHLSSNCVDQAIIISSECFTRNWCVHHFPTPFSGNWSPYFYKQISSTCSFSCLWLNGNPCAPVSMMYCITTFLSSIVNHARVSFVCVKVDRPSVWQRIVVWTSSIVFPVFFQFSSMNFSQMTQELNQGSLCFFFSNSALYASIAVVYKACLA